jgi:hypothetical protein
MAFLHKLKVAWRSPPSTHQGMKKPYREQLTGSHSQESGKATELGEQMECAQPQPPQAQAVFRAAVLSE